ncbi:MAG: C40 family peptidase [Clostridia bacterium]|nr:C40 family peptidase [Clostridia bacterium]
MRKHMPDILRAVMCALLAALTALSACAPGNRPLTEAQIAEALKRNEYTSEEQHELVEAAVSLVGKVGYFWGGKSFAKGPDPDWGTPREVTSTGHSTTGTVIPYGLDCSGFVQWCFAQLGRGREWTSENVGEGTWHQWINSEPIERAELRPGDLVFANEYPGAKSNHVGIVIGFAEDGEPLVAHCSPSFDGVVVTRLGDSFSYFRRFAFMTRL